MPVKLTTRKVKYVSDFQGIKEIGFEIPHVLDPVNGVMNIDPVNFRLRCDYADFDENGVKVHKDTVYFGWDDLPPQGKTMVRNLYQWLETKGIELGKMEAGDINDIEPAA